MKNLLLSLLLLSGLSPMIAQTAVNFKVPDCNNQTVGLFDQLDSGKVIVLCWVMPCGSCVLGATSAYNVAKSYATSYPGKVELWIADDYANTSCADIGFWCTSYNIVPQHAFSNSAIKMSHYGSDGMPKVVVVGGLARRVYFNQNNGVNTNDLQSAIELALTETAVNELPPQEDAVFSVSPNPAGSNTVLTLMNAKQQSCRIALYDGLGRELQLLCDGILPAGENKWEVDITGLASGIYFVRMSSDGGNKTIKLIVETR
jgi:hypothetical protein